MEINFDNDLYIESGNTAVAQDIPQNEGSAVLGLSGITPSLCRACMLSAITQSAVYGVSKLDSADSLLCEIDDITPTPTASTQYTFVFSGSPSNAQVYARSNGSTGGTYINLSRANTTGIVYTYSAMSYCISAYGYTSKTGRVSVFTSTSAANVSFTLTKPSSPYTFTFTGSPTAVGIGYRGLGTSNSYVWTTARTISIIAYSAIQYTLSATGYDTQTGSATVLWSTSSQTVSYQLGSSISRKPWTFTFTGTPTSVRIGYRKLGSSDAYVWTTATTIYPGYSAINYTITADGYLSTVSNATVYTSSSGRTIGYSLDVSPNVYNYSINVSPSAADFCYSRTEGEYPAEDAGNISYSSTVNNGGASITYTITTNYSPLYYYASLDGYDEAEGSITGKSGQTVTKAISLLKSRYDYWILVRDKKTGSEISGATIKRVVTPFSGDSATNSYGVAYIYAYSAISQVSVSAPHRGTQLMNMSSTLADRGTYGTYYGASVSITNIFDLPYYYLATVYNVGSILCPKLSGVGITYSGATTSSTTITTDATGQGYFLCPDEAIWVYVSKGGDFLDYDKVYYESGSPSSNTAVTFDIRLSYNYYTGMSFTGYIRLTNAKGTFDTLAEVSLENRWTYYVTADGRDIPLLNSDRGKTLSFVFSHPGANSITKQITIPPRTTSDDEEYFSTSVSILFTGSNKTLTMADISDEDFIGRGSGANITLKDITSYQSWIVHYRGIDVYYAINEGTIVGTGEVVLSSDVDYDDEDEW